MSASESKMKLDQARLKRMWLVIGAIIVLALIIILTSIRPSSTNGAQVGTRQEGARPLAPVAASDANAARTIQTETISREPGAVPPSTSAEESSGAQAEEADQAKQPLVLEKVDDYPLYTMTYNGPYKVLDPATSAVSRGVGRDNSWACSLFVAFGAKGEAVYGRNFDWDFSPAMLLFTHPPDGYASVSMVDMSYLGFDSGEVASIDSSDKRLLDAPLLPFDGMNEHGLTVGMAAVNGSKERPADPSKPTVGSLGIIRLMLDHAKNTDEAVALLRDHNIDFTGGPPLHYLIADPTGRSATVEFIDGTMQVVQNDTPWQIATNFFVTGASDVAKALDGRYATANTSLQQAQGQLSPEEAMVLLSQIKQDITQWSIIYEMDTGDINVAMGGRYETVHRFHLARAPTLDQ